MTPDALAGLEVLVLEDDYLIADDTRRALKGAGAQVIGPFADFPEALEAADGRKPSCALVDVNLGRGPNFQAARALMARGVPVVFMTGYDKAVIPNDLQSVPCVQKPAENRKLVAAVRSACGR